MTVHGEQPGRDADAVREADRRGEQRSCRPHAPEESQDTILIEGHRVAAAHKNLAHLRIVFGDEVFGLLEVHRESELGAPADVGVGEDDNPHEAIVGTVSGGGRNRKTT